MYDSVLISTKPRFSGSSHTRILQRLQHLRSNIVHEQWELSVQHHIQWRLLLHEWTAWPLWKAAEALHLCGQWLYCLLFIQWPKCIARNFTLLSYCFWHNPSSSFFFFSITTFSSFHRFCYWICGKCTALQHHVNNIDKT